MNQPKQAVERPSVVAGVAVAAVVGAVALATPAYLATTVDSGIAMVGHVAEYEADAVSGTVRVDPRFSRGMSVRPAADAVDKVHTVFLGVVCGKGPRPMEFTAVRALTTDDTDRAKGAAVATLKQIVHRQKGKDPIYELYSGDQPVDPVLAPVQQHFDERLVPFEKIEGAAVTNKCGDGVMEGYLDIGAQWLTVDLEPSPEGYVVDRIEVLSTAGGQPYRLVVPTSVTLCGTATADVEGCEGYDAS